MVSSGRIDEAEILCHLNDASPPCVGIGTVRLPAHEGNGAVPEIVKMTKR